MPRFRINRSVRGTDGKGSKFFITWIVGQLKAGDTFEVYEAGHWWEVKIEQVMSTGSDAVLLCDLNLNWDGQYSPVLVDTDADRPNRFRYVAT